MIVLVIAIPIVVLIIWLATRPDAVKRAKNLTTLSGASSALMPSEKKPKPPAGKLPEPTPPPHLRPLTPVNPVQASNSAPVTTANPGTPSSSAPQVAPAPIPTAPSSGAPLPTTAGRPPYAPLSYNARHEKAFGGCSGQLILSSTGLQFNCPGDSHSSMQIALSEISGVDENGVRLANGKKLHFAIAGMNKPSAQAIFADWFSRLH